MPSGPLCASAKLVWDSQRPAYVLCKSRSVIAAAAGDVVELYERGRLSPRPRAAAPVVDEPSEL